MSSVLTVNENMRVSIDQLVHPKILAMLFLEQERTSTFSKNIGMKNVLSNLQGWQDISRKFKV